MIIEKKYKPSHHKANARYRGVTEHGQYTNFALESAHDLLLLSNLTTGNEKTGKKGHAKEIRENFLSIMTGDEEVGRAKLFTASQLQKLNRERKVKLSAMVLVNDCVVTNQSKLTIASNGLKDPVGIMFNLYTEPGERLYVRLKVRSNTGAPAFSFGSNNMRLGPNLNGDTKTVPLPVNGKFVTVDHILHFGYAETVSININIHETPDQLKAADLEIGEMEFYYLEESTVQAASYHTNIKPEIDALEEEINSIR